MTFRSVPLVALVAVVASTAASAPAQLVPGVGRYGRQSWGSSVGALTPSVIGSWQWHGANDFVELNASPLLPLPTGQPTRESGAASAGGPAVPPPGVVVDVPMDDWIVDFVVLWRWRGQAVSFEQGSVGQDSLGTSLHRIVVGGRELSVRFDSQSRTAQIDGGPLVSLKDHNVLMLDVEERGVRVAGTLRVDLRIPAGPAADPMTDLLAQSRAVAAFVHQE